MDAAQEMKLKDAKSKAQAKFDEIALEILDGHGSLVLLLVKAYRQGHTQEKALGAFDALHQLVSDAQTTYLAAVAQPEPKVSPKSRVVL